MDAHGSPRSVQGVIHPRDYPQGHLVRMTCERFSYILQYMSTDIILDEGKYISSKRASEMTGYAQDYIGQLSRGALIDARRIGGLWYVSMDSLLAYKNKSEEPKPKASIEHTNSFPDADSFVHLDGKEYISASRASKITGYNQDYVGQLARGGKIASRQIGNRWYVDGEALLAHKREKDALLAAVQVQSVGIVERPAVESRAQSLGMEDELLTYTTDEGDLIPAIQGGGSLDDEISSEGQLHTVPIRVVERSYSSQHLSPQRPMATHKNNHPKADFEPKTGKKRVLYPVVALTVVMVLSIGMVGLNEVSVYASSGVSKTGLFSTSSRLASSSLVASAASGFESFISAVERVVVKELIYQRVH